MGEGGLATKASLSWMSRADSRWQAAGLQGGSAVLDWEFGEWGFDRYAR